MQFSTHKRRNPPTVIIVSLIDVLIVVLIFLMVTTTFKQQPSVKLTLPQSNRGKVGASQNTHMVTITKQGIVYLDKDPVTLAKLQEKLTEEARANPDTTISINGDNEAPLGQVVKVHDAAQAANIKEVSLNVKASQ